MTQKISPAVRASACRIAAATRALSVSAIMLCPYQLPDAPPPPKEPPPPPNEPPADQEEPVLADPLLLPENSTQNIIWQTKPPLMPQKISTPTTNRTKTRAAQASCRASSAAKLCARRCHSSASPPKTWMMSSMPRLIPPGKSPALNRGRIEF